MRDAAPTHPGEISQYIMLPVLGPAVSKAARQLRVTDQTLQPVPSGRSGNSADVAVRLGRFSGNSPGLYGGGCKRHTK